MELELGVGRRKENEILRNKTHEVFVFKMVNVLDGPLPVAASHSSEDGVAAASSSVQHLFTLPKVILAFST